MPADNHTLEAGRITGSRFLANTSFHLALLLVVELAAYSGIFSIFFLSDDFNLLIARSDWLTFGEGYFRPLPHLLVHSIYRIFGLNLFPYHLASLLLHYLNAVILYLILQKLFRNRAIALAGAILFCTNFLISEAVFWISSVTSLLVALFYLLGIYLYLCYLERPKRGTYGLVILCFILSLLAKENAVTFPVLLVLVEIAFKKGVLGEKFQWRACLKRVIPLALILVVYLVFKFHSVSAAMDRETLAIGYHNLRNIRHLLLSLFTFNPFNDLPFVFIDIKIINLFLNSPIPAPVISFCLGKFWLPLVLGALILLFCLVMLWKGEIRVKIGLLAFFAIMGPFIFISSHHLLYGGYFRYPLRLYYLPAAFFFIFLSALLCQASTWLKAQFPRRTLVMLVVFLAAILTLSELVKIRKRTADWLIAGQVTQSLIQEARPFMTVASARTMIFFNVPDSIRGAYIFRNGFVSALSIFYPQAQVEIKISTTPPDQYRVPAHLRDRGDILFIDCREGRLRPFSPNR